MRRVCFVLEKTLHNIFNNAGTAIGPRTRKPGLRARRNSGGRPNAHAEGLPKLAM